MNVGLLEAKRRFRGGKFESADPRQLERLCEHGPLLRLMLNDHRPSDEHTNNVIAHDTLTTTSVTYQTGRQTASPVHPTCGYCIPAPNATAQQAVTSYLYPFGLSLAAQISSRFMRGFDLHTDQGATRRSLGHSGRQAARYLLIITLDTAGGGETEVDSPRPNSTVFERIEPAR